MHNQPARLGLFAVVFITVVSVDSVRNLPANALFGPKLFSLFLLATAGFLIPCGLVTAELASIQFPQQKHYGIYAWFKSAFGTRVACWGVWLQWIENAVWYPTMLSYIAGTLGYLWDPALPEHSNWLLGVMLSVLWSLTALNLWGIKNSAKFSHWCTIFGLLIPMACIIGQGIWAVWVQQLPPAFAAVSSPADWTWLPNWSDPQDWVALTGIMLSFCGLELATVHGKTIENPNRTIPRALAVAMFLIASTLLLGSLAIAWVVPAHELNLTTGIMQAFSHFFDNDHPFFLACIGIMLSLGALGGLNNWISAPCESLLQIGQDGNLHPIWAQTNRYGAPYVLLIGQALLVTAVSAVFLWVPSINASYWFLGALTAQIYMMMYVILFLSALRLRALPYPRAFAIPGGWYTLLGVCTIGMLACFFTICIGFIPPAHVPGSETIVAYPIKVAAALLLFVTPGWFIFRKGSV